MKSKRSTLGFVLILLSALVFSGCGPTTEQPLEVPTTTPTEVALEAPTLPPEATNVSALDVIYERISFSYDDTLAGAVVAETAPAVGESSLEWEIVPEHVQFTLTGYVLPDTFHEPRIYVYPVNDFEAANQVAGKTIVALRQFLAEKPAAPDGIPFLPLFNAKQMIRAQIAYVDFQNGTGVRFLTYYSQVPIPVNNNELFYTFQGMTHDGDYYVAAILPVSHPMLPANWMIEIPAGDADAFAQNLDSYMGDIEQQLSAQDASSFTPDLSLLDAMIQSLELTPTSTLAIE
jgi:hypothetical protein